MKRNYHPIKLVLTFALALLVLSFAGCSSSDDGSRVSELEQQVAQLENELEALRRESTDTDATIAINASADDSPAEDIPLTPVDSALQATIQMQLKSNTFANWYSVATCQNATTENMMALAEKINDCQNWNNRLSTDIYDVCEKAVQNPAMTDSALAKMCEKPNSFTLLKTVADSPYAGEQALTAVIAALNRINNYNNYGVYDACDVIESVIKNTCCTDEILAQLETTSFTALKSIADAPCASTKTLIMVADRLMQIDNWLNYGSYDAYDVLASILSSDDATDDILVRVVPRSFLALWMLANSEKAKAQTLSAIITTVQAIDDWRNLASYDAYDVVKAVTENPNNSSSLMEQLAASNNSTAQIAAHDAIEKLS